MNPEASPNRDAHQFETVRLVDSRSIRDWRELRLRGLRDHSDAFGQSADDFQAKTDEELVAQMQGQEAMGGFVLAAVSKTGQMLGTVGLALNTTEKTSHRGVLWGMYVVPEARGQGIGRRLIEELLARAEQNASVEQVHLVVATSNRSALDLYQNIGFSLYGTDPGGLKVGGRYVDEHLMVLRVPRSGSGT